MLARVDAARQAVQNGVPVNFLTFYSPQFPPPAKTVDVLSLAFEYQFSCETQRKAGVWVLTFAVVASGGGSKR